MLTVEHDRKNNTMKVVSDKTVEHLDFEAANDFFVDVADVVQKIEELELERFADEYGFAERAWRE